MRRRQNRYLVRYVEDTKIIEPWKTHTLITTSIDNVHKMMECHSPGADVQVIYELNQVWGKG